MKKIITLAFLSFAMVGTAVVTIQSAAPAYADPNGKGGGQPNRTVGFIATTADKPAHTPGVIGFIATTADDRATGAYEFVDTLMKSITSERGEVSEKAVLEPALYSYFSRLERKSCAEVPGIGSIAGQDPPTFRRYKVHVVRADDKTALVKVASRAKTESGTSILNLALQLRNLNGSWKIFDVCSAGEGAHYCYRSEVKNWKC